MVNRKEFLLRKAQEFVNKEFKGKEGYPLITLGGSLGSPFGVVHQSSDIDIVPSCTNIIGDFPKKALLEPKGFKLRQIVRRYFLKVDIFDSLEDGYQIDVSYKQFSENKLKNILDMEDADILSDIDKYIDRFVDSKVLRDDYGIFMPLQERVKQLFLATRCEFLKKIVPNLYRTWSKIQGDWEMALAGEIIDFDYYNQNRQQYISTLIYIDALVSGLVISEKSVYHRRRSKLEKFLEIDQSLLRNTIARDEEDLQSFAKSSLQVLAQDLYQKAQMNIPDFNWDKYSKLFFQD